MDLKIESHTGLDISTGAVVLTYTHEALVPKITICRVEVGSSGGPIGGGDNYIVEATINGRRVSPDSNVQVPFGVSAAVLQSRDLLLRPGDELVIVVDGSAPDTAVDTVATLVDLTPLTQDEIYGGGTVLVDHNYGAEDAFRCVTAAGASLANVQIQAFVKSDYDAGNTGAAYVVGESSSTTTGRWKSPMALDPGEYVLVFFKRGQYGPDVFNLTVT
jgi:hypothetical protein